jgi:hypothetical protein
MSLLGLQSLSTHICDAAASHVAPIVGVATCWGHCRAAGVGGDQWLGKGTEMELGSLGDVQQIVCCLSLPCDGADVRHVVGCSNPFLM